MREGEAVSGGRNLILVNQPKFYGPLLEALAALGLEPVFDAWQPSADMLDRSLACFVSFYDCMRHPLRVWGLRRRLRRHGVPLAAWNRDAPHYMNRAAWRLDWLDRARLLDLYATHTLIDTGRSFADLVLYLPNGADIARYHPGPEPAATLARLRDPAAYRWDVGFFGGMNGARYKEDAARQEFFSALAPRLEARGISYRFQEAEHMSAEEQIAFVHASRINLNFGARCEYGAPVASGLPERCYGVPACGGFLLCDRRTHAADDFSPGEDWAEFADLGDCVAKIEFWLARFEAARDLAERCHRRVLAAHTYAHRAAKLREALSAWHGGERGLRR